ncbi:MAG: zinc ribbon domain-containing protein [Kiritimatiellales bacterium]|nr:zinc ribbon domain-containing protein [Kiritimatiellota bacterium]MBL7011580.1 zinc ribbon domain-containing protein [Kiritimatiellales bacterium]
MKPCRECNREVSEQAVACPECGAPMPAREQWDGWGFEYKSETTIGSWPLVHISFKYRPASSGLPRRPVPAKGIIAIGQFAVGFVTISQFGIGVVSISQFTIAGYALAQFAIAFQLIAQIGIYWLDGIGQVVWSLPELLGL